MHEHSAHQAYAPEPMVLEMMRKGTSLGSGANWLWGIMLSPAQRRRSIRTSYALQRELMEHDPCRSRVFLLDLHGVTRD